MELLKHQISALEFIRLRLQNNLGCFLGDPAGCGKTLPALLAARDFTPSGSLCLFVTIASAKYQLESEVKRFNVPFTPFVLNGSKSTRLNAIRGFKDSGADLTPDLLKHDLLIINYEQILTHVQELSELPISMIVADECMRLSNSKNKTWKLLYALANFTKARIG